jgi:hypothetical protein
VIGRYLFPKRKRPFYVGIGIDPYEDVGPGYTVWRLLIDDFEIRWYLRKKRRSPA